MGEAGKRGDGEQHVVAHRRGDLLKYVQKWKRSVRIIIDKTSSMFENLLPSVRNMVWL